MLGLTQSHKLMRMWGEAGPGLRSCRFMGKPSPAPSSILTCLGLAGAWGGMRGQGP